MDEWMEKNGWMEMDRDEWMDGWIDGWMEMNG
jgi:hypothetical protein